MWQTWDHHNRIFLRLARDTKASHRFIASLSYLGKADYQLVFKDGTYFSYEIKPESWKIAVSHLLETYGRPQKFQKEVRMKKLSSGTIQQIAAAIFLIGTIIYLVLR